MLAKYQVAVQWLESAMVESQKTENVDISKFLTDIEACAVTIQELVVMETDPLRLAALDQLSHTLAHHRNVLLAKKKQLETSTYRPPLSLANRLTCLTSETSGDSVCKEDSLGKRRLSAIEQTIVKGGSVWFDGVAGLEQAKQSLREAIVLPVKYPHLFTGGRRPWRSVLLYGPPGTGKTRLAQAVSSEIESTFYCVSSSDLISSWVGESEKIIKDLFQHARNSQGKSVIFIDEIDSVCRVRSANEEDHTRRVKTELLSQMEGADTPTIDHAGPAHTGGVFLLCATNCPWELDPAFLRRFQRRVYIPLPCRSARRQLFSLHLGPSHTHLSDSDWERLLTRTDGYSGSDIATCVADALLEPVRELETATHWMAKDSSGATPTGGCGQYVPCGELEPGAEKMTLNDLLPHQISLRPICLEDFSKALERSHKTVSEEDLEKFEKFTIKYGQTG